jgi:hypothetical protein
MNFLLTIYVGLITSSSIKETITLFICEREEGSRQYQYVMGLKKLTHTLSNLFYMMVYTSVFLLPFFVVVNLYAFKIMYLFIFSGFVVSTGFLTIALTSFFSEHKVATEVIGLLYSLAAFLPFFYDANKYDVYHYIALVVPNSSFTLASLSTNNWEGLLIGVTPLSMVGFYILIFYVVEFREDCAECLRRWRLKCRSVLPGGGEKSGVLMNDAEVEVTTVLT